MTAAVLSSEKLSGLHHVVVFFMLELFCIAVLTARFRACSFRITPLQGSSILVQFFSEEAVNLNDVLPL